MDTTKLPISNENGKKHAVFLTVDELTDIVSRAVENKLNEFKPLAQLPPKKEESQLNYAQAVAFLQISKPTFTKLRKAGKIKALRIGERRVLFNRTDLEAYIQSTHE